jgi:hypothetical protein
MNADQKNFYATILATISGILFLVSGTTGLHAWQEVQEFVATHINQQLVQNPLIHTMFIIIFILSSFGGITVLFGAWLLFKEHVLGGKIFISIGAGSGVIFLATNIYTSIVAEGGSFGWLLSTSTIAIILALLSRNIATRT